MMWCLLGAAIVLEVAATLALRASEGFRRKIWLVPVVAGYCSALYLLWATLKLGMPVGVAYGIWTACGVALVTVVARVLFKDPVTMKMAIGVALIVSGVLTIELTGVSGLGPR